MTTKQRRESKALAELRNKHGYKLIELRNKDERETTMFIVVGERMDYEPAVCIRLCVPAKSALGQQIELMRKRNPPKKRRRA